MALSQREKALVAIPVLLGSLWGFYTWVHQPLLSHRAQAQELSAKTRSDLRAQQAKLDKEGDLKVRLAAVTSREETVDAWVPGKNSAALFIWYLSQAEARSGVKVRGLVIGERREVQAVKRNQTGNQQPPAQASPPASEASPEPVPPVTKSPSSPTPGGAADDSVTTLTVIPLDLKVDGRFAEHLLFSQELESTPLFLSTDALELSTSGQSPVDKVSTFLDEGNTWMAVEALQASPTLNGNYRINLYFKGRKVGPSTEPMQFAEPTGRPDPFVMDSVDEFIQTLIDHFSSLTGNDSDFPAGTGLPGNGSGINHGQMG